MNYFESLNKGNEMWGLISEQILLGQINPIGLKTGNGLFIKPKISSVIIDKSSTGKGLIQLLLEHASSEIKKCMDISNVEFDSIVETQEAGLTGTVVKHEIVYGKLKHYKILIFPEASGLFVKMEHKKAMVMTLQCAIEDNGYVSKMVAGQEIKYKTATSIILCSTPFDAADSILVKDGIFQRCIVSYNNRSYDEIENNFENSRLISCGQTYKERFTPYLMKITDALEFAKTTPKYVEIPNEVNKEITKEMREIFSIERNSISNIKSRDVFDSYLMRAGTNADKMAVNIMFMSKKKRIDLECYKVPMEIFRHHIASIREMFNNNKLKSRGTDNRKVYDNDRVLKIINTHKGTMTDLYHKIEKSENMSWVTAINTYKEVIKNDNNTNRSQ